MGWYYVRAEPPARVCSEPKAGQKSIVSCLSHGALDANLAPLGAGLACKLLLGELGERFLLVASVAHHEGPLVSLHARHTTLDSSAATQLVDTEGRSGLELAAGHTADVAFSSSGHHAHRGCNGRPLTHETRLAPLLPLPGQLVAGKLGNRLRLVTHGTHHARHPCSCALSYRTGDVREHGIDRRKEWVGGGVDLVSM